MVKNLKYWVKYVLIVLGVGANRCLDLFVVQKYLKKILIEPLGIVFVYAVSNRNIWFIMIFVITNTGTFHYILRRMAYLSPSPPYKQG